MRSVTGESGIRADAHSKLTRAAGELNSEHIVSSAKIPAAASEEQKDISGGLG